MIKIRLGLTSSFHGHLFGGNLAPLHRGRWSFATPHHLFLRFGHLLKPGLKSRGAYTLRPSTSRSLSGFGLLPGKQAASSPKGKKWHAPDNLKLCRMVS